MIGETVVVEEVVVVVGFVVEEVVVVVGFVVEEVVVVVGFVVEEEVVDCASAGARLAAKANRMEVVFILEWTLRDSTRRGCKY